LIAPLGLDTNLSLRRKQRIADIYQEGRTKTCERAALKERPIDSLLEP
jgi:hypothetical protein